MLGMGLLVWLGLRRSNKWELPTVIDHVLTSPICLLASIFYKTVLFLRGRPFRPPKDKAPIRVVCISDTHDQTVSIPPGDILIHAGDLVDSGLVEDIQKQLDWLKAQPHPVKVVIAGNHDSWFDPNSRCEADVKSGVKPDLSGLIYLESESTEQVIRGRTISIFGCPSIPDCGPKSFAFQYAPDVPVWRSKVPPQTDILITHTPPKHHLDLGIGCPHLLREVWRVKPRLHVFGHVHWGAGTEPVYFDELQETYERLMSRPKRGLLGDLWPSIVWYDAAQVFLKGANAVLWKWLMDGPESNSGGLMVNAAQMYGSTGKVKQRPVVVDI